MPGTWKALSDTGSPLLQGSRVTGEEQAQPGLRYLGSATSSQCIPPRQNHSIAAPPRNIGFLSCRYLVLPYFSNPPAHRANPAESQPGTQQHWGETGRPGASGTYLALTPWILRQDFKSAFVCKTLQGQALRMNVSYDKCRFY